MSVKAQTAAVLGSIVAPGGAISIAGGSTFANVANTPLLEPTVDLGPASLLSTRGAVELTPNVLGYTTGSVLAGGIIAVSGNIVAEAGATLDVSGASGVLDVQPAQAGQAAASLSSRLVPLREDSNGGSITLSGSQELFTDATLLGAAGGPSGAGRKPYPFVGDFPSSFRRGDAARRHPDRDAGRDLAARVPLLSGGPDRDWKSGVRRPGESSGRARSFRGGQFSRRAVSPR